MLFPGPELTSATVATLFEGEGNLMNDGFCDFAFGFAQNYRSGKYTAEIENFRNRETNHTNQKGNWCYLYGFLIDTGYIVF